MIPERYSSQTYALMRIVFGLVFLIYGLQKWGMFGGQMVEIASLQGAAGVIETLCGGLIMIGLLTKPAAFLASGEMAVAYFYIHASAAAPLPNQNMGVPAALFCFAFLHIASKGAGIWSADAAMK